jgi:hypothetical protein
VATLSQQGRRLLPLLYIAAALIFLDQAVDVVGGVWPLHPDLTNWRVGTFGVSLSRLEFIALADALAVATALYLDHRRVLVALGVVLLLVGLVLVAAMALFALDVLQLRRVMRPERVRQLDLAAVRTLAVGGAAALACLVFPIAVWRTRQQQAKEQKPRDTIIVTGGARGTISE